MAKRPKHTASRNGSRRPLFDRRHSAVVLCVAILGALGLSGIWFITSHHVSANDERSLAMLEIDRVAANIRSATNYAESTGSAPFPNQGASPGVDAIQYVVGRLNQARVALDQGHYTEALRIARETNDYLGISSWAISGPSEPQPTTTAPRAPPPPATQVSS
jgi:hypothetical protein